MLPSVAEQRRITKNIFKFKRFSTANIKSLHIPAKTRGLVIIMIYLKFTVPLCPDFIQCRAEFVNVHIGVCSETTGVFMTLVSYGYNSLTSM